MNKPILTFLAATAIICLGSLVGVGSAFLLLQVKKMNAPAVTNKDSQSAAAARQKKISGLIVPHHDLVKDQREAFFKEAGAFLTQPPTVILISPNHYENGQGDIQTTDQVWKVSAGEIVPNQELIKSLTENGIVSLEPESFTNEHGIKLILNDIKNNFPQASILPLVFKTKTSTEKIKTLQDILKQQCDQCLMIASVDFSHYQPALLADLHDKTTLRALQELDQEALLSQAEVDSPPALALLAQWANSHSTETFVLKNHTNSGQIANDPDIQTTTHFFGWYESGKKVTPNNSVSFIIGGDMMFGRMIAHTFLPKGLEKSLDQIGDRTFWGTDAGIINLEGPISPVSVPDDIRPNNLVFNFPPETIRALQYLKANAASLANNHSANAGNKGLENTRKVLKQAGFQPIGGPADKDITEIATFKGSGLTLHVIGVHTLASQPDLKPLIQSLKADPNSRVLVFPHWGNEYVYKHTSSQAAQAHSWIDAGADLVIGAHPHVIEDSELYQGKPILYSLGNFLFDQTFSLETQQGLLVAGEFTDQGLGLFALPLQAKNLKPALISGTTKRQILEKLYAPFAAQKKDTPLGTYLFFPAR